MSRAFSRHIGVRPFSGRVYSQKVGKRWVIRYTWAGGTRTVGPDTPANRDEAERRLLEGLALARQKVEAPDPPPPYTLGALLLDYRENAPVRRSRRGTKLRRVTLENYAKHEAVLRLLFDPATPAEKIDDMAVTEVIERLRAKGWAETTIVHVTDYLRQAYRWAVGRRKLAANPVSAFPSPSRKTRAPIYSEEEIGRMLAALDAPRTDAKGRRRRYDDWRFRLVCLLIAGYGARDSQVRNLALADVDLFGGQLIWREATEGSKGQEDRVVPILPRIATALGVAVHLRPAGSPWVVPNWRDPSKPVTYDGMSRALRGLERRAKVTRVKGRGWHAWRRALMTRLAAELGLPQASALTGDTPDTIARTYLRSRPEDLAAAVALAGRRLETKEAER